MRYFNVKYQIVLVAKNSHNIQASNIKISIILKPPNC